jgi:hypothetical protein
LFSYYLINPLTYFYDAQARIFVGQIKSNGNITTIITNASEKYVKGLIK